MRKISLPYFFWFAALSLLLNSCQSSKPAFSFQPNPERSVLSESFPDPAIQKPGALQGQSNLKTVLFSGKKVTTHALARIPRSNAQSVAVTKMVLPPKLIKLQKLHKIKNIKDEPVKGPLRTISGVLLALGMLTLLVALALVIIGTSGAGTLAIVGGSVFVAGAILTLYGLLTW